MTIKIDSGDWGHSKYEAYIDLDSDYEDIEYEVTGVFAVCITKNREVVLSNNEPLGGHRELGESYLDTIKRESLEEGGFEILKAKYFGYYLVKQSQNISNDYRTVYPKESALLFFIAEGIIVSEPTDKSAGDRVCIPIDKISENHSINHSMLLYGVKLYPDYLSNTGAITSFRDASIENSK